MSQPNISPGQDKELMTALKEWGRQAAILALGIKGLMHDIPEGSAAWCQGEALADGANALFDSIEGVLLDMEGVLDKGDAGPAQEG